MEKLVVTCGGCLGIFAVWALFTLAVAWCVEWAWNVIAPVFHWPHIDYAVAVAICVLFSLIAGLFRSSQGQS